MITPSAAFTTENDKKTNEPVWIATIENDYLNARVSSSTDWQDASASGDADETTVPGSIICKTANVDHISESSYGSTTELLSGLGLRIKAKTRFHLYQFSLEMKDGSGSGNAVVELWKISDDLNNKNITYEELLYADDSLALSGSYQTGTYTPDVDLDLGLYLILIHNDEDPLYNTTINFKTWYPNEDIFSEYTASTLKGFEDGAYEIGMFSFSIVNQQYVYSASPFASGYIPLKVFSVTEYQNSTYTTKFMRVNDSSGSASAPTSSGLLYLEKIEPIDTAIAITHVYGDADGSAGSEVDLGAKVDGDSITAYPYYKCDVTLTTTNWWETPQLDKIEIHFAINEKIVLSDQKFLNYRPIVSDVPSLEVIIDPVECTSSISQPELSVAIHREGQSKTISWIESLVNSYYLTGGALTVKYGFKSIGESDFIAYQLGIMNDIQYRDGEVNIACDDTLQLSRDPLLIDSTISPAPSAYAYEHPVDIMYDLLSRLKVPDRSIDTTSFDAVKTSLSGWQFFRAFKENEKDIKKLLNEICKLTQSFLINQEDGKLYLKWLNATFSSVFAFTDDNSEPIGKCNLNRNKRINICSVQRGFWDEALFKEAEGMDKLIDVSLDETSIVNYGRGKNYTIENKWIPRDVQVSGDYISQIVADNFTNLFGQGVWILTRQTPHDRMYLQVGDFVTVETDQILTKGISGTVTKNGIIIKKKPNVLKKRIDFDIFLLTPWS